MSSLNENHPRSIIKTLSWRVLLTLSHIINAWLATGSWITGLQIAGAAAVINSLLYWAHERSWNLLLWQRLTDSITRFQESTWRSAAKTLSWRVVITASNFLIPFITTGSWTSAVIFLGLATVVNIIIYVTHERVWNRISWGKQVNAAQ
jgi:uncharacterized membrane protein